MIWLVAASRVPGMAPWACVVTYVSCARVDALANVA